MKKNLHQIIFVLIISAVAVSCSNAPQQTQTSNANTATVAKANNDSPLVASSHGSSQSSIAHSAESSQPKPSGSSTDSAPMMGGNATPIDTTELDAAIAKADKDYKAKSNDEAAKKALADAYAKRAFALTEAAQYRAALGDFRKSLKLDPTNTEAKNMHDQIVNIYQSMGREMPAEGQEPPPLPFKK